MAVKVLNKVTGKLEEHEPADAERLVAESGGDLSIPHPDQIADIERRAAHGTTAEQTLGALEAVGRTASFGAWQGAGTPEEIAGRQQTLREESPGVAFGAQAIGTVAPAIAGGALGSAVGGAVGLGARAAGALGVAAEGAAGGLAGEVEEAQAQGRPVSPGLAMLTGIGGEVVGRALPAAIRAGVNRLMPAESAAAVVAGEAVADVSKGAAKKAQTQLAEDAYHMPPGPDRDAALASTAQHQYSKADADLADASAKSSALLDELAKSAPDDLKRHVPNTTPAQIRWAAETAAELRTMADAASPAHKAELLRAAQELLDADSSDDIWKATSSARERLRGIPDEPAPSAPAPAADDLEGQLRASVDQAQARKRAPQLAGKTLEDLKALPLDEADRVRVDALKANETFAKTGKVTSNDGAQGVTLVDDAGELQLRDGRHRLVAAQELGRDSVHGRYVDGKTGKVIFEGDIPLKDKGPVGIKRSGQGARVLESPVTRESPPDFSSWDVSDFARGRGKGSSMGKGADDYSGGRTINAHQRALVDGLKQNAEFKSTGRVTGDSGGLKSEPTFVVQPDGTVKLDHGRLRITAARELGRDTVHAKVIKGKGAKAEVLYEGQIKVGGNAPDAPAPPASGAPTMPSAARAADELLGKGQRDPTLFGKAADGAADLHGSAQGGPGADSPLAGLEDQLAAAQRWRVGSDKARKGLAEQSARMRAAQALRDDTQRAVAATGAAPAKPPRGKARDLLGALAEEGLEAGAERLVGAAIPGAGLAVRGGKYLWKAMGDAGQAKVKRTVRAMLSPITSSGRAMGAARASVAMTALQRFAGDAPDARSAYEGRREMLAHVAANPKLASDVVAQSMAGLAAESPGDFIALSQRMVESIQYVASNLPPTVAISLAYPTGVPITDQELRDVADLWNTAIEPASALDDIEHLRPSPVQMQTLKEMHGDIYNDIRRELFLQAADTYQSIPAQTKLSLDIMFEADGLGGLFATNEAAAYVTSAINRNKDKGRAAPPSGKQSEQSTEAVESAGVRAVRNGVTNKGAA